MASFPGATTQWYSIPATIPGPWQQRNDTEANSIATDIGNRIDNLRETAEALAVTAAEVVGDCAAFEAPVLTINMPMPAYMASAFASPSGVSNLILEGFDPSTDWLQDYDFELSSGEFTFDSPGASPEASGVEPFDTPDSTSAIAVPTGAPSGEFPMPESPGFLELSGTLPSEPAAPTVPSVARNFSFIEASDIPPIEISTDNLNAVLEGVITAAGNISTSIPEYQALNYAPEKTSNLHAEFHKVRSRGLTETREGILASVWSQRGISSPFDNNVGTYNQQHRILDAADATNVASAEAIRYSLADARQDIGLAAALYGQTIEVQSSLFSARVEQLEAQAEAQRFLWESAVMAYRGAVANASASLSNNELANTTLGLAASIYKSKTRKYSLLARQNSLRHNVFAAQENAKRIYGIFANTTASGMRAEVTQHRVLTALKAAKLRSLGERITRFRQSITVWEAELAKTRSSYATYSAQARAAAVHNGLIASQVQLGSSNLDSIIEANKQLATETRIAAIDSQIAAKSQSTDNMGVEANNQLNAALAQLESINYSATAMISGAEDTVNKSSLSGIAYENEAASKFFIAASEGIHRAATIAQQANIQLASAYNTTQEAAGKAYASIEAGRLSGWTASAALQAEGTLTAQTNEQRSVVDGYQLEVSQSDSERKTEES